MKNDISEQYSLMLAAKPYHLDKFLLSKQKSCSKKIKKINKLEFGNSKREKIFYKLFGSIGQETIIKEGFSCNYGFNIFIGNNCYINYSVIILDSFEVVIGNNVYIAPNVVISPVTHPLEANKRKDLIGAKIIIEDNVWIGANATILPGVTLHKGAVVAAGAVVKKDVEEDTVVGGVPASFIKKINNKGESENYVSKQKI